ncbi:MAG TPA: hypothetical protein VKT49_19450 [Bryobacteraceae bacterium]|nr:hypothetical protein [Bryobacteraceae bacterium]
MDNLRYIRQTMERAGSFTAVPGIGGTLMGCTALVAAALAARQSSGVRWLAIWMAEAGLALLIGIVATAHKSARARMPLLAAPSRRFLAGFVPAMAAGALLTLWFYFTRARCRSCPGPGCCCMALESSQAAPPRCESCR